MKSITSDNIGIINISQLINFFLLKAWSCFFFIMNNRVSIVHSISTGSKCWVMMTHSSIIRPQRFMETHIIKFCRLICFNSAAEPSLTGIFTFQRLTPNQLFSAFYSTPRKSTANNQLSLDD